MIQRQPEYLSARHASRRMPANLPGAQAATDTLQLALLGFPQVTRGGTPVIFARRAAIALLAYLAVTRRSHSREALAALLGGEVAEERARMLLRNALTDLKNQIGDYLVATRLSISLNSDLPLVLDVAILEDALHVATATGDIAQLQLAVDRCQHEFLEGFVLHNAPMFDEWLLLERERISNLQVQALDLLGAAYIERGEYITGLTYARRLLALNPWREETHRQAMTMLALSGQRGAMLAQYEECRRVLAVDLGVTPMLETTVLYEQLRADAPPNASAGRRCDLEPNAFVGRRRELKLVTAWLEDPACRLVSIIGAGGCGKTRLALQATAPYAHAELAEVARLFPDGVVNIDLERIAPAPDRELEAARRLLRAIADALDITLDERANLADQVCDTLQDRVTLLLIDNLEHLRSGTAVLERLLRAAPGVKILVTSRVRLTLEGVRTLALEPMELPDGADDLERADASVLFLQQARQVRALFEPNEANRAAIVRICRLVDGLPLGIVLAAHLIRRLDCSQIASRLAAGTNCLVSSIRGLPDRHRSFAASFNYSWALLNEAEQRALRQLSVFDGPFSAEAAAAVASATVARLHGLHDAGMLVITSNGRYFVPGLLHPYVARLCEQAGEEPDARLRHAMYYTRMITQSLPSLVRGKDKQSTIEQELPNIQAAWDWVLRSVRDETELEAGGDIDGEWGLRELALRDTCSGRC